MMLTLEEIHLGSFTGNYLAEHADEAKEIITAAKIISVPWDVVKGEFVEIS